MPIDTRSEPLEPRAWDEQFGVFAREHLVLRYDVRGYGRSSWPEPGMRYSHVEDRAALMDAAGIERAALIGCSMGGAIELDFALVHPQRASALVLVAPRLGGFEGTPEDEAWREERQGPIRAAIEAGDLEHQPPLLARYGARTAHAAGREGVGFGTKRPGPSGNRLRLRVRNTRADPTSGARVRCPASLRNRDCALQQG